MKLSFYQVMELIADERKRQDEKYGTLEERQQCVPGFIHIARAELQEAEDGWLKNVPGKHSALQELIQVAAVCVAAIQTHGAEGNG
jgi:hypothetical protein